MPPVSCHLEILATPKASRTRVAGWHDGRIKIQIAAPPVDGAANDALLAFLAKTLSLANRQLTLEKGAGGRRKTVLVHGLGLTEALCRLGLPPTGGSVRPES
ncbi:MAG: DUF167 domain-containing protein [Bdellovibrionaceae bacterium]|nr:DUF167 domain-containing protein [Pseudobdellovibrionaceae bacterium]